MSYAPRSYAQRAVSFIALAFCATALSACLTPHVKPPPSAAVMEARARVSASHDTCPTGGLETLSPLDLGFAYDDAAITPEDQRALAKAAKWLTCNPGVEVVILPEADSHGDAAHLSDLAQRRAKAAADQLRSLGATAPVIHMQARGAPDPVTAPHLVISARGRGW